MDYMEFIASVTSHIPDKGQVMIRYYGLYSNAHRGKRRKAGVDPSSPPIIEDKASFKPSQGWSEMIKKVFGSFKGFYDRNAADGLWPGGGRSKL